MSKTTYITGWDIGGAHIKAARADSLGNIVDVIQVACPLWLGLEHLEQAMADIHSQLNNQNDTAAITMTGELVDLFASRQQGVEQIIDCAQHQLSTKSLHIYSSSGWLTPSDAKSSWQDVASMNWHASAQLAATKIDTGLFIDIGSTTCDIIPIKNNHVCTQGYSDFDRQITRELLYTGTIRTPLIALTTQAPFKNKSVGLAAELFATTGDCWVLTEQLDPKSIQDRSADGQSWAESNCAQRLARLLGTDADTAVLSEWQELAQWFTEQQLQHIKSACLQVQKNSSLNTENITLIGAGIGRFMLKLLATDLGFEYLDLHTLIGSEDAMISDHAPAAAVALLAAR